MFNSRANWAEFPELVVASGSCPGFFPPRRIYDRLWMDGGTAYNLELPSLIDFCRAKGFTDDQIKLDVILLSPTSAI